MPERRGKPGRDVARRYIEAWNEQDAEAVRACFTEDGCYIDSIHEREIIGDDIIAYAEASFEASPDMRFDVINETGAETGYVAVQWIMRGHGLEAFFRLPVSGERVSILGLDFLTLARNRIKTCVSYYDLTSLKRGIDTGLLAVPAVDALAGDHRGRLSEKTVAEIRSGLEALMRDPAVYTDPEVSLSLLAARLGVSPTYLSHVVNGEFALNFRDYINRHRIEAARRLLASQRGAASIADVGYQVGFNSSSAFYAAFRKFTGMTPLKCRNRGGETAADPPPEGGGCGNG